MIQACGLKLLPWYVLISLSNVRHAHLQVYTGPLAQCVTQKLAISVSRLSRPIFLKRRRSIIHALSWISTSQRSGAEYLY